MCCHLRPPVFWSCCFQCWFNFEPFYFPAEWASIAKQPWWQPTICPSASGPRSCGPTSRTRTRCRPPSWTRPSSSPSLYRATTSSTAARWPRAPAAKGHRPRTATTWWRPCCRCSCRPPCSHSRSSTPCPLTRSYKSQRSMLGSEVEGGCLPALPAAYGRQLQVILCSTNSWRAHKNGK